MIQIIDFFFTVLRQLWTAITDSWILSMSVLIACIGLVIDLVKAREQDGE